jgi:hypothetical protein
VSHYQTQQVTSQNGHVEQGCWRLSHAKSEYKDRCNYPKDVRPAATANCRLWRQFLEIFPNQISVYRISSASTFPEDLQENATRRIGFERLLRCPLRCVIETGFDCFTACRHVGRLLSNYSLVLYKSCLDIALRPFKDLGWHKEKKHRHHHRLSLLLKGLLATKPVVIFSKVR